MKLVSVIGVGLLVAGCATTEQLEQANARADALEQRLARIENDLYRVEVKRAPALAPKPLPALAPVKPLERTVQEMKIKAFLKEYIGAEFRDADAKFPTRHSIRGGLPWDMYGSVSVPVVKNFGYLDKAGVWFEDGQLYAAVIYMEADRKYSYDSVCEQFNRTVCDLWVTLGLPAGRVEGGTRYCDVGDIRISARPNKDSTGNSVMAVYFRCQKLRSQIMDEKQLRDNAKGETFPALN